MTGLDCLREEMEKRGCNKAQINSKVAAIVLDILSNAGDKYTKMVDQENELSERANRLHGEYWSYVHLIDHLKIRLTRIEDELKQKKAERDEKESYIAEFYALLQECETAEGRDAMKTAQTFINTVNVNTKYDNTAFIIGLSAILCRGGVNPMRELKKINPHLFNVAYAEEDDD